MKALPSFFIFSFTLIAFGCSANLIKIDPDFIIAQPGDVEINIYIIPSEPVAGAQCNFSFNKDVVFALNVTNGGIFEYWANDIYENFTRIDNQNGSIYNIVAFSSNASDNEGIFAKILFRAEHEGFSWLNITDALISDANGNKTSIEVINGSIIVDATPPNITFYSGNEFFRREVIIRWKAEDNYFPEEKINYSYSLDGAGWSEWSNSNETFYELDAGNYTFILKAKDEAGNIAQKNLSFSVIDITPPEIKNVKVDKINGFINISCDISDDFYVKEVFLILNQIYNYSMEEINGKYFYNASYPIGKYEYTVLAIDKSGNENTSTGNFSISPPYKPSLVYPGNNSTNISINPILKVHVVDVDNDIMSVKFYGRKLGNLTWQLLGINTNVANNSNTSITWYNLEYGTTYEWYAIANDSISENSSDIWRFTTQAVPPVNNPPVANDDYYSTDEDIMLVAIAPGVLENDYDADGDALSAILVSEPSHGSLTFNSNGSFTYTPQENYYGQDSFTYKAYDGKDYSNIATVYITINSVNDAPFAVDDIATTDEDISIYINLTSNDYDIDGSIDLTSISITQNPSHGSLNVYSNGTIKYTPDEDYYGSDSFKYKVKDNSNAWSNEAWVNITISSVNDAPNKPILLSPANGATGISINAVLSWQCIDVDGDAFYDVYFGTSSNPPKVATVTTKSYNPELSYGTTYYWRVVAKDGQYENSSDIWSFTTMSYTPAPPNQPPTCSLNANISQGYAPLHVNFIMNASDDGSIASWELDVDNDGIAEYNGSGPPPSTKQHVYTTPGNYTARLIVRDDKGANSTANLQIIVMSNISVDFDFSPLAPAPNVEVKFFALVEAKNYTWNFGDGNVSYEKNPKHAYSREGRYRVWLKVYDGLAYWEKNYTIDVIMPDFYVEAYYLPEKPKKGDELRLRIKIRNDGGYSENVKCYIFLDENFSSFKFNISEEYEKEILIEGINKARIVVDPENEIEEKDERNNEIEILIKYERNYLIYLSFLVPLAAIPAYFLLRKKKVIIGEEKIEKCSVCLGSFKEETNILRCDCGALYHKSCAKRVKNCINCNKKL